MYELRLTAEEKEDMEVALRHYHDEYNEKEIEDLIFKCYRADEITYPYYVELFGKNKEYIASFIYRCCSEAEVLEFVFEKYGNKIDDINVSVLNEYQYIPCEPMQK